jgi:hypothetical protein
MEFEALGSGIDGKRAMWTALAQVAHTTSGLDTTELKRLEQRGADQRKRVEVIRLQAARLALSQRGHRADGP